jgi:hypothetical protein
MEIVNAQLAVSTTTQPAMSGTTDLAQKQWGISDTRRRSLANLKPFPKGVSGNPGGRPKGQSLTAELRRQALEGNTTEEIARVVIKGALAGKIDFLRLLFDRVDGLLPKPVVVEDLPLDLNLLSDAELAAMLPEELQAKCRLRAALNGTKNR